jgi:hypothetical protein
MNLRFSRLRPPAANTPQHFFVLSTGYSAVERLLQFPIGRTVIRKGIE